MKNREVYVPKTYDEFVKHCDSLGIEQGTEQGNSLMRKFSAEIEDFFE
ncbi:hypothetical protein [Maribacter sp. Hel_I_7]|nr:hypothetical protein [Maribacter sp. Hel_I_7]